jgi:hypothetical protein
MIHDTSCRRFPRRAFLSDLGMGFTGMALASLLHKDGIARASDDATGWRPPTGLPQFPAKAKNVIWLFLIGGLSQVESFDPKPELTKYAGKTIADTPYKSYLDSPYTKKNLREFVKGNHKIQPQIYPLQIGYKKRGQSGIEVSDWFPHVGSVIDEISVIRSMWTTDNDHGAQLQFHTGRHALEGPFPTIGSWVHYGLGSMNENLPAFVVLGKPVADCCGGVWAHGASYLGPEHNGTELSVDPANPLPFAAPGREVYKQEQQAEFELLHKLNNFSAVQYPDDAALRARIKSYELAFRMQTAIPEVMKFDNESPATQKLYGTDNAKTRDFGQQCLAARRLVERGVRFVQVFHGSNGGAGAWDAHSNLKTNHTNNCAQVDQPIAALIKDLKQRGMLDDTIVVLATEFGRTPGAQGGTGRDHHPFGFSILMAGGGLKRGVVHGATDELGFHAVENRHYVTDVHATVLHQLGLDAAKLAVPGRKRLKIDLGEPMWGII